MLVILSPAKTINTKINNVDYYNEGFHFPNETEELISILKEFSVDELCSLMKISEKLGLLNYDRYRNFYREESRYYTAVLAFMGEAYRGLDAESLSISDLEYSNEVLRILSGLYGLIKPLDLIKEYRLEMGTKLINKKGNNLYDFWDDKVTNSILSSIEKSPGDKVLVNLASKEYSSVLDFNKIRNNYSIVDISFLEYKNGSHKMISVYAKKARGLMTRFIIENKVESVQKLKEFDIEGYMFNPILSKENELVFTR